MTSVSAKQEAVARMTASMAKTVAALAVARAGIAELGALDASAVPPATAKAAAGLQPLAGVLGAIQDGLTLMLAAVHVHQAASPAMPASAPEPASITRH